MKNLNSVCVLGLGYIGLPTASFLAARGHKVLGVDVNADVVATINRGDIHIVEPDLDILVRSAVQSGSLSAALEPAEADVFIIAVPTPFKGDHIPDVSYVEKATQAIAPYVKPGNLVILESTSPTGTTDECVARILSEHGVGTEHGVYIAHCPERVLPGRILIELVENDRVVGGVDQASTEVACAFYENLINGEVIGTNARTAEMAKLTENAFRDVNIAFANELSMISQQQGINVWELIRLANRHPRVNILNPGPGVGGHCIAVDPWFIVAADPENSRLIRTAREVNDSKPEWVIDRVRSCASRFKDPVIGCLGLAFKADVDDLRESPALSIVRQIQEQGLGQVIVSEPNLDSHDDFELMPYQDVIKDADILLILVDHKDFRKLKAADLKETIVIDTRGVVS